MNARILVLALAVGLTTSVYAQGVLGRRTLGNLDIETITQNDIQVMRSRLATQNLNDTRAAEFIKKQAVNDEDFKNLRSRLPSSVLMDSMNTLSYVQRSIFRDTLILKKGARSTSAARAQHLRGNNALKAPEEASGGRGGVFINKYTRSLNSASGRFRGPTPVGAL